MRGTKAKRLRRLEGAKAKHPSDQRLKPCKQCSKYALVKADDKQPLCQGCRKKMIKKVLELMEEGGADG